MMEQSDLVEILAQPSNKASVSIVSCGSSKADLPSQARSLYTSPLFRKSLRLAEAISAEVLILSAKHGLVSSTEILSPYNLSLNELSGEQSKELKQSISRFFAERFISKEKVFFFGGKKYLSLIEQEASQRNLEVVDILRNLPLGKRIRRLNDLEEVLDRRDYLGKIYALIENWNLRPLSEFKFFDLPTRGVYLFFDRREASAFSEKVPRIVRIGTHAVSRGSKSNLRTRLRAHYGLQSGGGNHRGSIFRLHVGNSIIQSEGISDKFPTWAQGGSAPKEISNREVELEERVSGYLRNLLVAWVPISDEPSSESGRAIFERALISIIAGSGGSIDPASKKWLGRFCPSPAVQESGIWNIQHVGKSILKEEAEYVTNTIEQQELPLE